MFLSPCFYAHFEVSHQKPVMETPNSLEVVFDLCKKQLMGNNVKWKRICWINSSMRIKNDFAQWDSITALTSGPRCTASEMLLWSFLNEWAKSVIKVILYNCLLELSYTRQLCTNNLLYMKIIIFIGFSYFFSYSDIYCKFIRKCSLWLSMEMVL